MNRIIRVVCVFLLGFSSLAVAQNLGTGLYAFGSFDSRGFDSINIGNLNTHFEIPIVNKQGRGLPFSYSLVYEGLIWSSTGSVGNNVWQADGTWGFRGVAQDHRGIRDLCPMAWKITAMSTMTRTERTTALNTLSSYVH
jgi:hypothetical protein